MCVVCVCVRVFIVFTLCNVQYIQCEYTHFYTLIKTLCILYHCIYSFFSHDLTLHLPTRMLLHIYNFCSLADGEQERKIYIFLWLFYCRLSVVFVFQLIRQSQDDKGKNNTADALLISDHTLFNMYKMV